MVNLRSIPIMSFSKVTLESVFFARVLGVIKLLGMWPFLYGQLYRVKLSYVAVLWKEAFHWWTGVACIDAMERIWIICCYIVMQLGSCSLYFFLWLGMIGVHWVMLKTVAELFFEWPYWFGRHGSYLVWNMCHEPCSSTST